MVQFKPYFLGEATPPAPRAATSQKCLRTTDIEEVGDTSHCTFFEMLGNFSFGDYFKAEAVAWAWEFLFDVLHLDVERVRVTVHEDDDEAYALWLSAGMPARKIFRFDEHSNYWPASVISKGPNGPCGPCSEIFWDTQPELPPTPDGVWDDKRWLEIWNLVFMQYERSDGPDGSALLTPLPRQNIDTGMGLERTAAAIAGLRGPFETDLFAPLLRELETLSGKRYGASDTDKTDVAFRRVADHARASAFCLADGVLPSNVGRGYVLRRLLRRAILAGRSVLGIERPFLAELLPVVIAHREGDYPELREKADTILRYARMEEAQFRRTLEAGTARLLSLLSEEAGAPPPAPQVWAEDALQPGSVSPVPEESARSTDSDAELPPPKFGGQGGLFLSGDDAFTLFTTYGFPVEMTQEMAAERGFTVDMARFRELLDEHARISEGGKQREVFVESVVPVLRERGAAPTLFVGYAEALSHSPIAAILRGGQFTETAGEGERVQIVLEQTPFYAEAGGQVGDTGVLHGETGAFDVADTQKEAGYVFHSGTVRVGELRVGDTVEAAIDAGRRASIQRNHTVTHLLHQALQDVLGPHVQQRGSLVAPERLRFDFAHDQALTPAEQRMVEGIVNEKVLDDLPVRVAELPIAQAKTLGARMLFGEKYGDIVRVVEVGDYSREFCGGTHLGHTSQAGLFKIVSEGSSQAGVRRLEAVTGKAALLRTLDQERILSDIALSLKTSPTQALPALERLQVALREKERELTTLQKAASGGTVERLVAEASAVNGLVLVSQTIDGADADALRTLCDEVLNRLKSGVVVLGSAMNGKVSLAVKASADWTARGVHAGNIVKEAAQVAGGGGGGRPDFAQAGGKDPAKLQDALSAAAALAAQMAGA